MILLAELTGSEWVTIIGAIGLILMQALTMILTHFKDKGNREASDRRAADVKGVVVKAAEIQTAAAAGEYAKASELKDSLEAEISNPTKRIKS